MTNTLRNFPSQLEDALYSLATAGRAPTATDLDELIRDYPKYADDLVEIIVELATEALVGDKDDDVVVDETTSPAVSRAMSRFNNRLHEVKNRNETQKAAAGTKNIFLSYNRADLETLAKALNANSLFVIKLRDRVIDPSTITIGFRQLLAEKCKATLDEVIAHLSGPRIAQAASFYKANQKPQVAGQQTFEEAVRQSGLTQPQQNYLLSL